VSGAGRERWAWAEIDLGGVAHNVRVLREIVAPAAVWAVVKADGYGHGALAVSRAALAAGAAGLCVALATEGAALRDAGVAAPILVLSEQPPGAAATIVEHRLIPTVSTAAGVDALAAAVAAPGFGVHLKVDTGMHRVGAHPADVAALARRIAATGRLRLAGVFTHLAVADEVGRPETAAALARFDAARADLPPVDLVHAANSAGALAHPAARHSLVRAGIAVYGISPGADLDAVAHARLRPVMTLKARVSFVNRLAAGEALSYGLRHTLAADANVATVPIGYADGVRRGLSGTGTEVLIGGRRHPIVGTVTMDQILVDCGDFPVAAGDEVVLIGAQGGERVRAEDWAAALGTIGYEVTCGIGARVGRRAVGDPVSGDPAPGRPQ